LRLRASQFVLDDALGDLPAGFLLYEDFQIVGVARKRGLVGFVVDLSFALVFQTKSKLV
jgi:hypothetical protein